QVNAQGGSGAGGGATGSGFVVDDKGHVITNNHVVADATGTGEIEVVDHQGQVHPVKIVGRSPVYDIAVLLVEDPGNLRPAALGSSQAMRIGESVVAIGSPLGLSSTVTSGIVSALDRPVTTGTQDDSSYINAVQTDAAINPGNSGGPLLDSRGRVIGINTAILRGGGAVGAEGLGFAVPINLASDVARQVLETGRVRRAFIGIQYGDVTPEMAREFGLPVERGIIILAVQPGSPAARAGILRGDIITRMDAAAITSMGDLRRAIRERAPGQEVAFAGVRPDGPFTVRVRLSEQ
ncbi:MAG TPA: trypsin-like peptidase domain-containing protein, partial [Longimicrobium sp.]